MKTAIFFLSMCVCSSVVAMDAPPQQVVGAKQLKAPEELLEVDATEKVEDCCQYLCINSTLISSAVVYSLAPGGYLNKIYNMWKKHQPQSRISAFYDANHTAPIIRTSESIITSVPVVLAAGVIIIHGGWGYIYHGMQHRNAKRRIERAKLYNDQINEHYNALEKRMQDRIDKIEAGTAARIEKLLESKKTQ